MKQFDWFLSVRDLSNRLRFSVFPCVCTVIITGNNTQMTSERVKNKKVRHETMSDVVTFCSLHARARASSVYSGCIVTVHAHGKNVIYLFYTSILLFFSPTVAKRLNFRIRLRFVLKHRNFRRTSLVLIP